MAVMSDAEPHPNHHHGPLHGLADLISEHHDRVVRRHEEEALEEAADQAAFDLAADIGHPTVLHTPVGYDVESDIGIENEPPQLRR
jgi:hypothetical protein